MIKHKTMDRDEGIFMDFNKIHLEHEIGKGSFGTIFLAKYGNEIDSYALKRISK